ncbi:hypothetical protein WJX73_004303 [Symbiochloris irregularis]|uniref:AB hydrolase-1 domain-containing protein n=1 Tax=Symbiochloris irregularis TaxID=706552 RepID=A0AAW1NX89_9CHLO
MADSTHKRQRVEATHFSAKAETDLQLTHITGSTFSVPGLQLTDHWFTVPLDHTGSQSGTIQVFVREVVSATKLKHTSHLPFLLFLQGGPGFESPRVTEASAWIKAAAMHFRIVLMDQRGTGLSSAITANSLALQGTAHQQAAYLGCFRADSIIQDAEVVRAAMVPRDASTGEPGRWSIFGQSFGGFCVVHYLSTHPHAIAEALLTGGLPPGISQPCSAETAYHCLFRRVLHQNSKFYKRFPGDQPIAAGIVRRLIEYPDGGAPLPGGGILSPRGFQLLGLAGLGSGGGFERLHYLLERAFDGPDISHTFLRACENWFSWDTNPLYAVLHESIYCQGAASQWAAQRVRDASFADAFDAVKAAKNYQQVLFTGEMVFPWMFDEIGCLQLMKAAAELLAMRTDWPRLYDLGKLHSLNVPVAAACYFEDMYVDFELGQETASHIQGIRQWITNEYMHSGIRDDGARIFEHLLALSRNTIPLH